MYRSIYARGGLVSFPASLGSTQGLTLDVAEIIQFNNVTVAEEDTPAAAEDKANISEEEVDELLHKERSASAAPGEVRDYNLAAPEQIVRGRMPTLDRINERWVGGFQQALEARQRAPIDVVADEVRVLRYSEWLASLSTATTLALLTVQPVRGSCLVATDTQLLSLLVLLLVVVLAMANWKMLNYI